MAAPRWEAPRWEAATSCRYRPGVPVTAVLCPHPPLLLPDVTGPVADDDVHLLRAACRDAVAALLGADPQRIAVVGPGVRTAWHEVYDGASSRAVVLAGFGVPAGLGGSTGPGVPAGGSPSDLPLSLAVGTWLLDEVGTRPRTSWLEVADQESPQECRRLGVDLAATHDALLVLGDGSSRRGDEPPGGPDERAEAFDTGVAAALAEGDGDSLLSVDPGLAAELGAGGRVAWQVLAGWARQRPTRGRLTYDAAPFGVAYHVATWSTPAIPP